MKAVTLPYLLCIASFLLPQEALYGQALPATQTGAAPQGTPTSNTLLDGTPVKLRLSQTISSAEAKTGQQVSFEVVEDVKVQGLVVIAKGASALATVTEADHKKTMGRGGKLDVNIDSVRLDAVSPERGRGQARYLDPQKRLCCVDAHVECVRQRGTRGGRVIA